MPRTINGCPYKASNTGACTHKAQPTNRKGKRYCGHEFPHNCSLFMEWIDCKEKQKKSKIEGINPPKNHIGDSN